MTVFDQDAAIAARDRLVVIAQSDTGQSRRVANFLLAWWNAGDCRGFGLTDLWMRDRALADDSLAVARLVSTRHQDPSADDDGPRFEELVAAWRPRLFGRPEAGRA